MILIFESALLGSSDKLNILTLLVEVIICLILLTTAINYGNQLTVAINYNKNNLQFYTVNDYGISLNPHLNRQF